MSWLQVTFEQLHDVTQPVQNHYDSNTTFSIGNVENELFLVLYFDPHTEDGVVHVRNKFFTIRQPTRANALGLYECFTRATEHVLGASSNWEAKCVGFGCDGTSVNIAAGGLRGHLEEPMPWIVVFWCLAHRLELSLKDALKNTFFSNIDDMLLRLYYLYEKSPKKCNELKEVVDNLKLCLEESEMPNQRGIKPVRACGTRFVSHKVFAINRLIERYGAYLTHLVSLTEDPTVKATDKQKIKGFILQWRDSKMLLGCALFHDLLKPAATLCKVLQDDEVCVISAIEAVLKTSKNIQVVLDTAFKDLSMVKKVLSRIQDDNNDKTYQGAVLAKYEQGRKYLEDHKNRYAESIMSCLKERLKMQHVGLLTDAITLLATHGWEKSESSDFADAALDHLTTQFNVPLAKAGVVETLIKEEFIDMLDYAKSYLPLSRDNYLTTWWKLFNSANSKNWTNILALVELVFCLPMSNGRVERIFSRLKLIKTNRRCALNEDHLDDAVRIAVEGPPLAKWDASAAVHLWWTDKNRRQVGDTRKPPARAQPDEQSCSSPFTLDAWEDFLDLSSEESDS